MKVNQGKLSPTAGLTWGDIFPVLHQDFSQPQLCISMVDADMGEESRLADVTSAVAYAVVESAAGVPLSEVFPQFHQSGFEVPWAALDTRTMNCLTREGIFKTDQLMRLSVADLQGMRNAGSLTVLRILRALTQVTIDLLAFAPNPTTENECTLPKQIHEVEREVPSDPHGVLEALRILAEWHCLRGAPTAELRSSEGLIGCPDRVGAAWDLIVGLRPIDLIDPEHHQPAVLLNELLARLDEKALAASRLRLFADEPWTLDQVGQHLGVTRERVRQILNKAFRALNDPTTESGERIQELSKAVRTHIGNVCSLDQLLLAFPALAVDVDLAGQPAWRVLDRLDDSFEIEDGWAAIPSMAQARELTTDAINRHSSRFGLAPLAAVAKELGLNGFERNPEFHNWLEYLGTPIYGDEVVARSLSIPDWAAIILHSAGSALSLSEISDQMPVDRAESSIRNALAEDNRFIRADRDAFALAEWGGQEYTGIRDLIAREVQRGGGQVTQDELVRTLTDAFDVAESSVRTYSQAFPFEMRGGIVRMRTGAHEKILNPSRVRRLFRCDRAWKFHMTINADHVRGSGSVLSSVLAGLLGLKEGESRKLPSGASEQSIYWTGMQPSLGSIRRFIQEGICSEGDEVFAIFHDDGSFSVERILIPEEAVGIQRALYLAGFGGDSSEDPRNRFARALSLTTDQSWASIISTVRDRGDDDIAAALLSDGSISASEGASERTNENVSVDEILRLL